MEGNYSNTINILAHLINSLNYSRNFYSSIINLHKEHSEAILLLLKPLEEFLQKLLSEYNRLTGAEFVMKNFSINVMSLQDETEFKIRCAGEIDQLIDEGAEVLNKDILWEVLPVLANNLSHLITAKENLLNCFGNRTEHDAVDTRYENHESLAE